MPEHAVFAGRFSNRSMMHDMITAVGVVGTIPRHINTAEGLSVASFRLASTQRRFDRATGVWTDGETNWYTVSAFRHLADNLAESLSKGDRVIVRGRLKVRQWQAGEKTGVGVDIDAEAVGHDLLWGRSTFTRSLGSAPDAVQPAPDPAADAAAEISEWHRPEGAVFGVDAGAAASAP